MSKRPWPFGQLSNLSAGQRLALSALCALAAIAMINYLQINAITMFMSTHAYRSSLLRVALLGITAGIIYLACLTMRRLVFVTFLSLVLTSYLTNVTFKLITGTSLTTETFEWLASESAFLFAAIVEFRASFLRGALMALLVLGLLLAARWFGRPVLRARASANLWRRAEISVPVMFGLSIVALSRFGPNPMPWESNLPIYVNDYLNRSIPSPGAVTERQVNAGAMKVVMIVDESVRPDVFRDAFGADMRRHGATELPAARTTVPCSSGSNALIRWGANPRVQGDIKADPRANPGLFGYARAAGYRTHLFDAQTSGPPQNFMSLGERNLVDDYAAIDAGHESDRELAKRLNAELRAPGRSFMYVVKRGAHFPYESNYPASEATAKFDRHQRYREAVTYANRAFFDTMLADIDLHQVFVIYTSDHGQQFDPAKSSHCNAEPSLQELEVPLWLIGDSTYARQISGSAQGQIPPGQGYSSLQLFPTLVIAMGYDAHVIEQRYYYSLAQRVSEHWLLPHPFLPFPSPKSGPLRFQDYSPAL
ncbi:sulfatase-like hydrolase/transferase [Rugamonas apoptosis]|uniref:Sulfatase-like hydrolase/transferase n=1 Tax=Rugamonas apoptosis TaxID=2758570 RepID=A0A7W2FEB9_9BURK|nr:sulfatase-like hydrolase/transferase [Rugamonas apoptosis]MBA5690074.1 sulfatase-like hydrolase/transferase [Rugamonas apoptosis]